ncbi:DUF4167 domain-containing protein [Mesorhizobium sp. B2-1-8]|uniref:DUF4167 domain-containing protein n=1 Tax=unclassified Mesorhizobium TaxID=325217 RepID=UPI00112DAF2B|nr:MULTISPECIES: DUF4167 domain-containing protein [unclassified Mesorhizobium]MBZ9671677.1 DUF4167 domain-containing protein [Mesorhizobium sp. ES1-3]TPI33356.1 DUF4167 domain-containing protein [Mesorhizobium sp. B3-2-1]UCI20915.1 DUF4167 domain-containing protein [Mesorhizobium sp. B2-1-8]
MRPQQQNRRMRGRNNNGGGGGNNNNNNNNRKGPNPLTRNYESNGPDVKIRGSAQQIAEKYATLARDAQSSGDRVMAENYLQHAEHYNRIIAAAQAQMPIQNVQQSRDEFDEDGDEDRDEFDNAGNSGAGNSGAGNSGAGNSSGNAGSDPQIPVVNHGAGPQPVIEGMPAEVALNRESGRDNRDGGGRDGGGRNNGGRDGGRHRDRRPNGGYGQNSQRDYASSAEQGGQQQRNEASGQTEVQAVPASPSETVAAAEPAPRFENFSPAGLAAQAELNEAAAESGAARRPRRPRRPRANPDQVEGGSDNADAGETTAAPGESGSAEPVIADIDN